jgi:hypothetical protein
MCEHCSDGSTIWAAIPRLAAYSKLSERKVQRLIRALLGRGILSQLAPSNTAKRRPATYRINEAALNEDPRMAPYRAHQQPRPGIHRASPTRKPVPDGHLVSAGYQSAVRTGADLVSTRHRSGVGGTPDSKTFDPNTSDSKAVIRHRDAALNSMPAWCSLKERLRAELSEEEWSLWVRPMFLLKAMPVSAYQKHLLAAVPANSRIQSAAMKRLSMMRELLTPAGFNISLTRYPDDWEIEQSRQRYGVDMRSKPWTRKDCA